MFSKCGMPWLAKVREKVPITMMRYNIPGDARRDRQRHLKAVADVAAVGAQRRGAHRRNPERRGVALAEQRRGLVAAGDVVEHARHEAIFVERLAVVADRGVGLGAARDIAVQEFRNPAPRHRLEIIEREIAFQRARHRAAAAGHRGWRGSGHGRGFIEHVGVLCFWLLSEDVV
jgi:hypothetical protein